MPEIQTGGPLNSCEVGLVNRRLFVSRAGEDKTAIGFPGNSLSGSGCLNPCRSGSVDLPFVLMASANTFIHSPSRFRLSRSRDQILELLYATPRNSVFWPVPSSLRMKQ